MKAAIADARRSLPTFWKWLESGDARLTGSGVAIAVDTANAEGGHIWLSEVRRTGKMISGRLADQPPDLPYTPPGSLVAFGEDRILDWMLIIDGRRYGGFTTRYMLDHADIGDEAARRASLSDKPVPNDP